MTWIKGDQGYINGHVLFVLLVIFLAGSDGNHVVRFTFNCTDIYNETSVIVGCPGGQALSLSGCPENHVVVAAICLGQSRDANNCIYKPENCHDSYRFIQSSYRQRIDDCLWKESRCELSFDPLIIWSTKNQCSTGLYIDYIYAADVYCVQGESVHDICEGNGTIITDSQEVGYLMSPGFPGHDYGQHHCHMNIVFNRNMKINFILQYRHLEHNGYRDFVRISVVDMNGEKYISQNWTGTSLDHQQHELVTTGFLVEYKKSSTRATQGFLLSYEAAAYDNDPTKYHTDATDPMVMMTSEYMKSQPPITSSTSALIDSGYYGWFRSLIFYIYGWHVIFR